MRLKIRTPTVETQAPPTVSSIPMGPVVQVQDLQNHYKLHEMETKLAALAMEDSRKQEAAGRGQGRGRGGRGGRTSYVQPPPPCSYTSWNVVLPTWVQTMEQPCWGNSRIANRPRATSQCYLSQLETCSCWCISQGFRSSSFQSMYSLFLTFVPYSVHGYNCEMHKETRSTNDQVGILKVLGYSFSDCIVSQKIRWRLGSLLAWRRSNCEKERYLLLKCE